MNLKLITKRIRLLTLLVAISLVIVTNNSDGERIGFYPIVAQVEDLSFTADDSGLPVHRHRWRQGSLQAKKCQCLWYV